jgi:hypothetical protein
VRWRYKHVGAPDNRIIEFPMELVLTPWGKDMIPELGLGSRHPTEKYIITFPNFQQLFRDYFFPDPSYHESLYEIHPNT